MSKTNKFKKPVFISIALAGLLSIGAVSAMANGFGERGFNRMPLARMNQALQNGELPFIFKRLNLTAEQETQIKAILAKYKPQTNQSLTQEQFSNKMRELMQKEQSLIQAKQFDENLAKNLFLERQAIKNSMNFNWNNAENLKMRHEIFHILNDEQQAKLLKMRERMNKRFNG